MAKSIKTAVTSKKSFSSKVNALDKSSKIVVPMPGRRIRHHSNPDHVQGTLSSYSNRTSDLTLEAFREHFLMERDYPID